MKNMSPSPCERIYHRTLHSSGILLTETRKVCVISRNKDYLKSEYHPYQDTSFLLLTKLVDSQPSQANLLGETETLVLTNVTYSQEAGYGDDISKNNYHCKIIELLLLMSE